MEEQRKEYSEDDSFDASKTSAEYGNNPKAASNDNTGNDSFGNLNDEFDSYDTTGSGFSEQERSIQDGKNSDYPQDSSDNGSEELIERYNVNDKAHSDSSAKDHIATTSSFLHQNGDPGSVDDPANDSRH